MRVGIQVYLFGGKLLLTFFIQRLQTHTQLYFTTDVVAKKTYILNTH